MDIIFFAAVAFFVFYKLSKQLGKIDEEEKKSINDRVAQRKEEMRIIQEKLQQRAGQTAQEIEVQDKASEKILETLDEKNRAQFLEILQSAKISAEFFLNGAKSAFEMIIKAFAASDLDTLKMLLAPKIYEGFESAINKRKSEEKTLNTNIIAIEKVEIVSVMKVDNTASVAVRFVSKQINYVTGKNGEITEGRKDAIAHLTDVWTFKKDLASQDPNWVVTATSTN